MSSEVPQPGTRRAKRSQRPRVRIDLGRPLPFDEDPGDSPYDFGAGTRRAARGSSRILSFALVAVLAFAGGAAVQKREVEGYLPPPNGLDADLEAQERATAARQARPEPPVRAAPVLAGTVVSLSGYTVVVRDAQGVERTVRAGATTAVRTESSYDRLAVGQDVAIYGQLGPDGSVALASEVLAR